MRQLFVNGYELDLFGNEQIAITYQVAPVGAVSIVGNISTEFSLPNTNNNRKALELPGDIPNSSTSPYRVLNAQYLLNGIDQRISFASIASVSNVIRIRLFGGNASFISALQTKLADTVGLNAYNHTRSRAVIEANLQSTSGFIYPLIKYNTLGANYIDVEYMYPAFYLYTLVEVICDGYTLSGDILTNADYQSVILPFSKQLPTYTTDFIDSLKFEAYQPTDHTMQSNLANPSLNVYAVLNTPTEVSDPLNLLYVDVTFPKYHALITATYAFDILLNINFPIAGDFTVQVIAERESITETIDLIGDLDFTTSIPGSFIAQTFELSDFTSLGSGNYELDDSFYVDLKKGDKVWLLIAKSGISGECTIKGGAAYNTLELTDITNYNAGLGDTWQIAPNMPALTQGDIIKFMLQAFGQMCIVDEDAKTISFITMDTIKNNIDRDDWSLFLDVQTPRQIDYVSDVAQVNYFKYKDDQNFTKPDGADYTFTVDNKNLEAESTIYEAPFGATVTEENFTETVQIPVIDLTSNQLQPRVLVNIKQTFSTGVDFREAGMVESTQTAVSVPHFISGDLFSLGWSASLIPDYNTTRTNTLKRMRILRAAFRLSTSVINQLDFQKPVWIERYNSNFYKSKIDQYNGEGLTQVELIEI